MKPKSFTAGRLNQVSKVAPLRDFIDKLLPAVKLSDSRLIPKDRFLNSSQEIRKTGLLSICLKVVKDLQELNSYNKPLPKSETHVLQQKYSNILNAATQTIPFSHTDILPQFQQLLSSLVQDLEKLDSTDCTVYFSNLGISSNPYLKNYSGQDIIFSLYKEITLYSNRTPLYYFFLNIFINRVTNSPGFSFRLSPESNVHFKNAFDNLFSLPSSNNLLITTFLSSNAPHRSLLVYLHFYFDLTPYISKQELLNCNSSFKLSSLLKEKSFNQSKFMSLTALRFPDFNISLAMAKTVLKFPPKNNDVFFEDLSRSFYVLLLKPYLLKWDSSKRKFHGLSILDYKELMKYLVFSPFSPTILYDVMDWLDKKPSEFVFNIEFCNAILKKIVSSDDKELILNFSQRFLCDTQSNSIVFFTKDLVFPSSNSPDNPYNTMTKRLCSVIKKLYKNKNITEASFLLLKLFKEDILSEPLPDRLRLANVSKTGEVNYQLYTRVELFPLIDLWELWAELVKKEQKFLAMEFFVILHQLVEVDSHQSLIFSDYYTSRLNFALLFQFNSMVNDLPLSTERSLNPIFNSLLNTSKSDFEITAMVNEISLEALFSKINLQLKSPWIHI